MRSVFVAAAAALALTSLAAIAQAQTAQTPAAPIPASRCPPIPEPPAFPDGATTRNAQAMERGNQAYTAWGQQVLPVLQCRQQEARDLRMHAEARVNEYNAANQRLRQICRGWMTEVNEFNARHGKSDEVQDLAACDGARPAAAN